MSPSPLKNTLKRSLNDSRSPLLTQPAVFLFLSENKDWVRNLFASKEVIIPILLLYSPAVPFRRLCL